MERKIHILFGFDNPNFVNDLGMRLGEQGIILVPEVSVSKERILETLRHTGPIKTAVLMKTLPSGDVFSAEELASIMDDNDVNIIIICHAEDKSSIYMQTLLNNGIVDAMFDGEADYDKVLELVLKRRSRREAREYYGLSNSTAAGIKGTQRPMNIPQAPIQPRQPYRVQGATYDPSADWQETQYAQSQPSPVASAPMYGDSMPLSEPEPQPQMAQGSMFAGQPVQAAPSTEEDIDATGNMFGPVSLFEGEEEAFIDPGEDDVVAQEELFDDDDVGLMGSSDSAGNDVYIPQEEVVEEKPTKSGKAAKPKKEKKEKKVKEKKAPKPSKKTNVKNGINTGSNGSMFTAPSQPAPVPAAAPVTNNSMFAQPAQQGVQSYAQYNGGMNNSYDANARQYIPGNPMSPAGFNNVPQGRTYVKAVKKEPVKQSGSPFLVVLVILVIVMIVVMGIFGITALNYKIQSQKANDAFREAKEEEELLNRSYSKSYEEMMEEAEQQSQEQSDVKVVEEEQPEPTYEDMNDITRPEEEPQANAGAGSVMETENEQEKHGEEKKEEQSNNEDPGAEVSETRNESPDADTVLNRDGTSKNDKGTTDLSKEIAVGNTYSGKKVVAFIKGLDENFTVRDRDGNNIGITPSSDVESIVKMSGSYKLIEDNGAKVFVEQ